MNLASRSLLLMDEKQTEDTRVSLQRKGDACSITIDLEGDGESEFHLVSQSEKNGFFNYVF